MTARKRVVVIGGGFAGLEAAFNLRMRMRDAVDIHVVADSDHFLFKPNTIYIPFGGDPEELKIPLQPALDRKHIAFDQTRIEGVEADRQRVVLQNGDALHYDSLVLATGASMRPGEIPGLSQYAETIWTPGQMAELGAKLKTLEERAHDGQDQRVLFLVPPGNKCSGPLYEIVFMLETWAREREIRDRLEIVWSTCEGSFIQAFGPRLHDVVDDEFMQRGVLGYTDEVVTHVEAGEVHYEGGAARGFDLLISFPPYIAAVDYEGFERDERGFLATDLETRLVAGHENIYAPGDGGDFPVKQAFLAFLQADAVADHITRAYTGSNVTTPFDPVSMCVMEMFDKAVFAQVPLTLTGDPARPVAVREGAEELYKVGVSPAWRLGKKLLGVYLPMRFRAGEPFHAGTAWQMMDMGLTGMVEVMAD